MYRIKSTLAALVTTAATLTATTAPAQAQESSHDVYRTGWTSVNDGTKGPDDWSLHAGIHYTYTKRVPGHDKVHGSWWVKVWYNQEGDHMSCDLPAFNRLQKVIVDLYFSDPHGRNWHRQIEIPCDEDTAHGVIVQYKGEDLYTDGHQAPQVRVNWKIQKFGFKNDTFAHFGIALRAHDGDGMQRRIH